MRLISIFFFLVPVLGLCGCQFPEKHEKGKKSPEKASLLVPEPTTYCEKSWHCSYETMIHEEARRALVQKRKAFVTACEDALRRMPADLVKKYEGCTRATCGDELQKCLLQLLPTRDTPAKND